MIILNIIGYIVIFLIGIRIGAELDAIMVDRILDEEIKKLQKEIEKIDEASKED